MELRLTGLVVKRDGQLQIYNRIYQSVFDLAWVEKQLANLRPYGENFDAWKESNYQDESRLLRGQALLDAQSWADGKSLSDLDYHFLNSSQELDKRTIQTELDAQKQANQILAKARKRASWITGISLSLLVVSIVATIIVFEERKAVEARLKATSSKEQLVSGNKFTALIEALRAGQQLKQLNRLLWQKDDSQEPVLTALGQTLYEVREHNTLTLSSHQEPVYSVSWSPDGQTLATGSADNTVKLWNKQGKLLQTLNGHQNEVRSVSWSPDGQTLATGSWDNTVKLWNKQGKLLQTLSGHQNEVYSVSWSRDGQILATGSADNTVKLWNKQGKVLQTLSGHQDSVNSVSWSRDGQTLATGSADNTVKLWNKQGKLLQTLSGHQNYVWSVSWSLDGQTLATGSADNTVKLWKVDTDLDVLIRQGCYWVSDYLKNNRDVTEEDRHICAKDLKLTEAEIKRKN